MARLSSYRGSLLVLVTLFAVGCGSGSGSGLREVPTGPDAAPDAPTVSGNAVKGAIRNAEVSFTPISGGGLGTTLEETATTDVFGDFAAVLPSGVGGTVLLQVTAAGDNASSSMVCDLPGGCGGGMGFGDVFPLPGDFKLRALLTDFTRGTEGVSINIFSDLEATLVLDGGGTIDGQAISEARNRVADLFDLERPLFRLEIRDLSSERFDDLDSDAQVASLLAVGLMASISPQPRNDFGFDLEGFRQNFLAAGGTLPINDEGLEEDVVSLRGITSIALGLADDPLIADRLQEGVRGRLADRAAAAAASPPGERTGTQ